MSSSLVEKPSHFFKAILSSTLEAKKLKIPNAFVPFLNGFPRKALIQNRKGKLWHVRMSYTHEGVFFLNGWQNFAEDNSLEHRDILVFKYDGDKKFDVRILGKSACEKSEDDIYMGFDTEVKMEEEEEEKKKEEDDEDGIVGVDASDEHGEDSEDALRNAEEEEWDSEVKEAEATPSVVQRRTENFVDNGRTKKRAAKRARLRGANDILAGVEVRKYVQHQNPYFVAKFSKRRQDLLFVPSYVLKDFGLQLAEHVTFHDKLGGKWPGKVIRWKDGRTCIKGWRAVCRWNHVEKDDACICEFPQTAGNKRDVIIVHIIRGVGSRNQSKTELE